MNILIIGCGYVGKAAAKLWKNNGHHITATTRQTERIKELKSLAHQVIPLTGTKKHAFQEALKGQDIVLVSVAPDKQHSADYEKTYLHTALDLAHALQDSPPIKQLIYTSSISVYGDQGGKWIDENQPVSPANSSTQFLCQAEKTLAALSCPVCILRLGEIYGPGRAFSDRLRRFDTHLFPGTGQNFTNIIHLDNIVNALNFSLEHQLEGIYNLCEDLHITRKELYQKVSEEHGLPMPTWDPTTKSLHGGNKRILCDKIKKEGFTLQPSVL